MRTLTCAAALAVMMPLTAAADSLNVTIAAGHPSVFRSIRIIPQAFIPAVNASLAADGHAMSLSEH